MEWYFGSWALLHISVLHVVSAVIDPLLFHKDKIKNTILPLVDSVKELGVMVDHHLKFDIHISLAVRKAMLQSRLIRKCFSSRNEDLLLKAYITYVRPILEYCSPVWSPHLKNLMYKIEFIQKFFTKGNLVYGIFYIQSVSNC